MHRAGHTMRLHLFGSLLHGVLGMGRQGWSPWGSCRGQGRYQAGPHGRSTSTGTMLHYVVSGCEETAAMHHAMYADPLGWFPGVLGLFHRV